MNLRPLTGIFLACAGLAQTPPKLSFEVASIKQSPQLDVQAIVAAAQAGGRMPTGPHVDRGRAEYRYMSLTSLISVAYQIDATQITGPDWLLRERWDIVAKMPEG